MNSPSQRKLIHHDFLEVVLMTKGYLSAKESLFLQNNSIGEGYLKHLQGRRTGTIPNSSFYWLFHNAVDLRAVCSRSLVNLVSILNSSWNKNRFCSFCHLFLEISMKRPIPSDSVYALMKKSLFLCTFPLFSGGPQVFFFLTQIHSTDPLETHAPFFVLGAHHQGWWRNMLILHS